MSSQKAQQHGVTPLGYFKEFESARCEPDEMGIGAVFVVPKSLQRVGLGVENIDLCELNEAFSS